MIIALLPKLSSSACEARGILATMTLKFGGTLRSKWRETRFYHIVGLSVATVGSLQAQVTDIEVDGFLVESEPPFQFVEVSRFSTPPATEFGSFEDVNAFGGERDISVTRTSSGFGTLSVDVGLSGPGTFSYASGPSVAGSALITWDGKDASSAIDYLGLNNMDFTDSGINTGIEVGATSDLGTILTFTFYTSETQFSSYDLNITADPSFTPLVYGFYFDGLAAATPTEIGLGGAADFSDIGAITLGIDGESNPGTDVFLTSVAFVPEPRIPFFIGFAVCFLVLRRRRISAR